MIFDIVIFIVFISLLIYHIYYLGGHS